MELLIAGLREVNERISAARKFPVAESLPVGASLPTASLPKTSAKFAVIYIVD